RIAPDAGDADRIVDPAGHRHAADTGGTTGECEGTRGRALVLPEEPLPAEGLERISNEEEERRAAHEDRVGVMERPAALHEVLAREPGDREQADAEAPVDGHLHFPIFRQTPHPRHQRGYRRSGYAD